MKKIIWSYIIKNPILAIETSQEIDKILINRKNEIEKKKKELEKVNSELEKMKNDYDLWINTKIDLDYDIDLYYARKINDKEKINELLNKDRKNHWSYLLNNFLKIYKKDSESLI